MEEVHAALTSRFDKITRETNPSQFVGLQLLATPSGIALHQDRYTQRLLDTFPACSAAPTPAIASGIPTDGEPCSVADAALFRKMVGMLLYLANWSRPDIASAVRAAAQGMAAPTIHHLAAARRVVGYLRGLPSLHVNYTRNTSDIPPTLDLYVDADHAGERDRQSITGMVSRILGQGPFAWRSQKQHLVAMSSTEAELIALADCAGSISVLRRLLGELDLLRPGPTVINEDNISAITVLRDVVYNGRTKHIDIRLKSIRDLVRRSALALEYCQTKDQLADMFTKSLGRDLFQRLRDSVLPQCGATREE